MFLIKNFYLVQYFNVSWVDINILIQLGVDFYFVYLVIWDISRLVGCVVSFLFSVVIGLGEMLFFFKRVRQLL